MNLIFQTPRGLIVVSKSSEFPKLADLIPYLDEWRRVKIEGRVS